MSVHQEIEALRVEATAVATRIATKEDEAKALAICIRENQTYLNRCNQRIAKLSAQLAAQEQNKDVRVSDHALLRYIERAMGVDLDKFRAAILTEQNRKAIEFAGDCTIKSGGVEFLVKNRTVVTVIAKGAA
ncbi:MAG: hypothetical protein HEQ39_09895 [Rhizobacter sp.]